MYSSRGHPLLPTVIRGLLTRRVAPAPARQSFTLESNPRLPHASHLVTRRPASCRGRLLRRRKVSTVTHRESRASARAVHGRDEKSRRRRERYWRRSLTTLPLLAWQPSRVVPALCICRRGILAPRRTPRFSRRGRAADATTARTRKRSPRF